MKLIIEDDEGRKTVVQLLREEITIGRQEGNTIKLSERNVSRRHARLKRDNSSMVIEDLGSYNGVRVNGERISAPTKVKEGDLIEIGDYDLGLQGRVEFPTTPPPGAPKVGRTTIPPTMGQRPSTGITQPQISAPPPVDTPPMPIPAPGAASTPNATVGGATAIIRVTDLMKPALQVEARDLSKSEMPRLMGISGSVRGKEFFLMRTEVKIGRSEDNDISIDHQSLSRQHARFVLEDGSWKVVDNKSANGVHINGELYAISAVRPGDTVELGHLKFRFCGPGEKFTLPSDKEEAKPGLRPTTAELIAGAREAPKAPAAKKSKLPLALGAGALVVAVVVAFLLVGRPKKVDENGEPELSAGEAIKAGDREFKKHEYLKALEYYDAAAAKGEKPANRAKAQEEARAQEIDQGLDKAIAAKDFDKARALYERCATETTWFCEKVREKGDQVKAGYAAAHLAKAQRLKAEGKLEPCKQEVQQVLALDSSNAEAQALSCAPSPPAEKPATARHEGGGLSQAARDQKANQLILDGNAKVSAKDYAGAAAKYQAALDLKPSKQYMGYAYRGLGTAAVYAGDTKAAVKWYKLYMPYADDATKGTLQQLIDKFGG
ncbi:MAG TPA: FHA domain-containing protein [Myxococcales bacterium]|nr:FHA domain-containing protein [Myxococcales bacterium]